MRNLILTVAFIFTYCHIYADSATPGWQWANVVKGQGSSMYDGVFGNAATTDINGNIYVTGKFNNTANFGSVVLNSSQGGGYIAKYSSVGNLLWVKQYSCFGRAIAVGTDNCIYIRGTFGNTITIGGSTLTSAGGVDVFVAKLDSIGTVLWAKAGGGPGNDDCYLQGMTLDPANNVIIGGSLGQDTASFEGFGVRGETYLTKYDSDGNIKWLKTTTSGHSIIMNVASDYNGNIYVVGGFNHSIQFDGNNQLTTKDNAAYLTKFDNNGDVIWASGIDNFNGQADGFAEPMALGCDHNGNVCVFGGVEGSVNFGAISSGGKMDYFLAKYDVDGKAEWVNRFGTHEKGTAVAELHIRSLQIDKNNNINLLANYSDTVQFDQVSVVSKSGNQVFVAQYDGTGKFNWVNTSRGNLNFEPQMAVSSGEAVYVTGYFQGNSYDSTAWFGYQSLTGGAHSNNMFLAKIADVTGISKKTADSDGQPLAYPNPFSKQLKVDGLQPSTRIQLFDVLGRMVIDTKTDKETAVLNTTSLLPGSYYLKLTSADGKVTSAKLVKE